MRQRSQHCSHKILQMCLMSCLLAPVLAQTLTRKCCAAGSSKGFFDSSVGAEFANRSESPKKSAPAPRKSSSTKASSGGGGFFDSSVGSQFANRSESPKKAAPRQATPTRSSSGKLLACCYFTAKQLFLCACWCTVKLTSSRLSVRLHKWLDVS